MRTKDILSKNVKKKKRTAYWKYSFPFVLTQKNLIRVQEAVAVTKEK